MIVDFKLIYIIQSLTFIIVTLRNVGCSSSPTFSHAAMSGFDGENPALLNHSVGIWKRFRPISWQEI